MVERNLEELRSGLSPEKLRILEKLKSKKVTDDIMTIKKRINSEPSELSFQQQRLWFLDQLVPNNPAYNVVMAFHTSGNVNLDIVEKSINKIIERHEVLRTNFKNIDGCGFQVVNEDVKLNLLIEDLKNIDANNKEEVFKVKAKKESEYIFNLSDEPLIRMTAFMMDEQKYIFLLNVHHIIIDGWSMGIFFKELLKIYSELSNGQVVNMEPLKIQYSDYSIWQREFFKGKELERQLAYWKDILGNKVYGTDLPTDKLRPPVQDFQGGNFRFSLNKELTNQIVNIAKETDSTPYMVLMTALNVLLYKYTGNDDIVVGTPIANRNRVEVENLIGFFVNTLVFKTKMDNNIDFIEALNRVKQVANGAYMHQDLPFELLVDSLHPTRDMSYNPLFQVCFVYQNTPKPENTLSLSLDKVEEIRNDTSKFDLWIQASEENYVIEIDVEYNSNIFELSTIERFMKSYELILKFISEDRKIQIDNIDIISSEDKDKILNQWNNTFVDYNIKEVNLYSLIEEQINKNPNNIAVRFDGNSLTYGELNIKVNKICNYLRKQGIKEQSFVGICMERSFDMILTIVSVLKLGAAYVPLDPTYPKDRLNYMINDSNTPFIIIQERFSSLLQEAKAQILNIEEINNKSQEESESFERFFVDKDDIAYMIYTSGSTGKPKGVTNTHKGIVNRLLWMKEKFEITTEDKILQKTPFSFDVSLWELFLPLISGATLVFAIPEGHKDVVYLVKHIQDEKITRIHFVPSMLTAFLEEEDITKITSLKSVICSGEVLPVSVKDKFFNKMNASLYNLYGPTEAAVDVSYWKCEKDNSMTTVPIGKAIANTELYIVNENLNLVPIGVPGEICIGGVQVATGYYNKLELTKEKFIKNPFKNSDNEFIYRTGDLGRFLSDGNIEYIGRLDSQVKIRGFRIELEEIENKIQEDDGIKKAIVTAYKEEDSDDSKLVAYLVPTNEMDYIDVQEETPIENEQVDYWNEVFDSAYNEENTNADDFNIVSWKDSYSGRDFTSEEMKIWVDTTVKRISDLKPTKVLEIGCGTGLLLSRIAPNCERYVACDFSQKALDYIESRLINKNPELSNVTLYKASADELDISEEFDVVVINSVIQYFPNEKYLLNVIQNSIQKLKPKGAIFIGDVRNLNLIKSFATEVTLNKCTDNSTKSEFDKKVEALIIQEEELVIAPEFFYKLQSEISEITHVEIMLKESEYSNELTQYRYDAILFVNEEVNKIQEINWLDFNNGDYSISVIKNFLLAGAPNYIGIDNILNKKVSNINKFMDKKEYLNGKDIIEINPSSESQEGIDPNDWFKLASELNYKVTISWILGDNKGKYRVVFIKNNNDSKYALNSDELGQINKSLEYYINNPLLEKIKRIIVPKLKSTLKDKLPEYMIPSIYMVIKDIPTNSNGKLDYKALPKPYFNTFIQDKFIKEAGNSTEIILSEIWKDVLSLEKISIDSNFFELGGDSIKSILVVSKLKKKGIIITPQMIFQNSTIEELSKKIIETSNDTSEEDIETKKYEIPSEDLAIIKNRVPDYEDVYPLTAMQDSMVYQLKNNPKKGLYVVHHAFILKDKNLDTNAFKQAWQYTLNNFEALKTSFIWEDVSHPVQVLHKEVDVNMVEMDWRELDSIEQEIKFNKYVQDFRADGYNLNQAPQSQVTLIRKDDETYYFIYFFNLMLQDGWSYPLVITTLFNNYKSIINNEEVNNKNPFTYRQYIDWQYNQDYKKAEAFWKDLFKDVSLPAPKIIDPKDFKELEEPYVQKGKVFSMETTEKILNLAQRFKTTPYTLLELAWSLALNKESNCTDLVFGSIYSGRNNALDNIENGVGLFFNLLPIRIKLNSEMDLDMLLKEVQDVSQRVGEFEYTPIRKIYEWCNIPEDSNIFESYLVSETLPNLEEIFSSWMNMGATPIDMIAQTEHAIRFIVFFTKQMGLVLNINYYKCYHTEKDIDIYLDRMESLLNQFLDNSNKKIYEYVNALD